MANRAGDDTSNGSSRRRVQDEAPDQDYRDDDDSRRRMDAREEALEEGYQASAEEARRSFVAQRRSAETLAVPASALTETVTTAIERSATLLSDNIRTMQEESARFFAERLKHDMQAMEQMARSRSMIEIFTVQQKWMHGVLSAYGDGLMRMSQFGGRAAQDAISTTRRMGEMAGSAATGERRTRDERPSV